MLEEAGYNVTVGVVDEDTRYHASLLPVSVGYRTPFSFYHTAREALRRGPTARHSFWLISVDLSEVSGFDLFEMLRDELDSAPVCLVARTYRREDEFRAYRAGAAMYACRPVEVVWLRQCLRRPRGGTLALTREPREAISCSSRACERCQYVRRHDDRASEATRAHGAGRAK